MLYKFRYGPLNVPVSNTVIRTPRFYRTIEDLMYGVVYKSIPYSYHTWDKINGLQPGTPVVLRSKKWCRLD